MIDDAAKRLLGMVEDVLVMGKLRVGSSRAVVSDFSTDDVYRYVCGLMKPLSERKGLACGLAERAETVPMRTDREMVERIVVNLVSNAIKFTDEGSIHLATYADGDDVIFEVTDTGRGIAPEQLDRVMEEFHQVVEPDGVKPVGTGLGLAISRRMAEDLGGTLTVASVVGQGSTFTLRIPRVHPNA
jgi:signal transduction histidine kinase